MLKEEVALQTTARRIKNRKLVEQRVVFSNYNSSFHELMREWGGGYREQRGNFQDSNKNVSTGPNI